MQTNPRALFSTVLITAQSVLTEVGPDRKVYTEEKILTAFRISKIDYDSRNYRTYQTKIVDAEAHAEKLDQELNELLKEVEAEDGFKADPEMWFDSMDYLDHTCLRVKNYLKTNGADALCYPWKDRTHISACFRHYHTYKFLEKHIGDIGREEFLRWIPDLECFIIDSRINDTFYWDQFDTEPLYELEREKVLQREMMVEECVGKD